jgi:hypothetical protein
MITCAISVHKLGLKMTTTHGFFVIMGGCVWTDGDGRSPHVWIPKIAGDNKVYFSPHPDEFPGLKALDEEDIHDRSK